MTAEYACDTCGTPYSRTGENFAWGSDNTMASTCVKCAGKMRRANKRQKGGYESDGTHHQRPIDAKEQALMERAIEQGEEYTEEEWEKHVERNTGVTGGRPVPSGYSKGKRNA